MAFWCSPNSASTGPVPAAAKVLNDIICILDDGFHQFGFVMLARKCFSLSRIFDDHRMMSLIFLAHSSIILKARPARPLGTLWIFKAPIDCRRKSFANNADSDIDARSAHMIHCGRHWSANATSCSQQINLACIANAWRTPAATLWIRRIHTSILPEWSTQRVPIAALYVAQSTSLSLSIFERV